MKNPLFLGALITMAFSLSARAGDTDGDGLSDVDENTIHLTDPNLADSDYDTLPDGWEIFRGLNPNSSAGDDGQSGDPDGDGVVNSYEYQGDTDPNSAASYPPCLVDPSRYGDVYRHVDTTAPPTYYSTYHNWYCEWTDEWADEYNEEETMMRPALLASRLATRYPLIADPTPYLDDLYMKPLLAGTTSTGYGEFSTFEEPSGLWADGTLTDRRIWVKASPVTYARNFKILKRSFSTLQAKDTLGTVDGPEFKTYGTATVETLSIPANGSLSNSIDLLPVVSSPEENSRRTVTIFASHVTIAPDDYGITGVIGDMVPSNKTTDAEDHFVSPKQTTEIPQDYVIFRARGVGNDDMTVGHAAQIVEWSGGEAVPGEPFKRRVKRDVAGKTEIIIRLKGGGATVAKLNVWVVWWDITATKNSGPTVSRSALAGGTWTEVFTNWSFVGAPQPISILDFVNDVPNLTGTNASPVPNFDAIHVFDGDPFGDATYKWDISRQWRARSLMPTIDPNDVNWPATGWMKWTLPAANLIHTTSPTPGADHYPLNPVEGNDDTDLTDVDVYAPPLLANRKLLDEDSPGYAIRDGAGTVSDTAETRLHFKEFARAELGKQWVPGHRWYRVSDYKTWRFHHKLRKVDEAILTVDVNGDGDKVDKLWVDDGSVSDATNTGF